MIIDLDFKKKMVAFAAIKATLGIRNNYEQLYALDYQRRVKLGEVSQIRKRYRDF